MARRNGVLVEIKPEDLTYAKRQDRYGCAIVRAIERRIPEATRVRADDKRIVMTIPDADSPTGATRYYFETPLEVVNHVIRPFDQGMDIDPEWMRFTLKEAIDARPMTRKKPGDKSKERDYHRKTRAKATHTEYKHIGRFMDEVPAE